MRGVNSVFVLGTLRGQPEQLTSKAGKTYVRFELDVVTVRKGVNGADDEEQREVVPITVFGKLGEIVTKYVVPGDPVHVMARVSSTEFKADSGATRRSISVIAESVQLIPKGRKEESKK